MVVNLSDFFNSNETKFEIEGTLDSNESDYILDDVSIIFPVYYKGVILNLHGELLLKLDISYEIESNCSRCLKLTVDKVETELEALLVHEINSIEQENDLREYLEIKDFNLNLYDLIISQVITSMPFTSLCDNECKGICQVCGQDLNIGECSCEKINIDPRFESLLNFSKDDEEV